MSKRFVVIAVFLVAISVSIIINDRVEPGSLVGQNSQPRNSAAQRRPAVLNQNDRLKLEASSKKALQSLLSKLLPSEEASVSELRETASDNGVLTVELLLKGVIVEGSDMKIKRSSDGTFEVLSGEIPRIPANTPDFPTPRYEEAIDRVRSQLKKDASYIRSVKKLESSWFVASDESLVPCLNVDAWYETAKKSERERWCVDAKTFEIKNRRSMLRKF